MMGKDARPHPNPLPQERVKVVPRPNFFHPRLRDAALLTSKIQTAAI